jgi:hypothetical protein
MLARMAMIETTTSNSIKVNAGEEFLFTGGLKDCRKIAGRVNKDFKK